VASSRTMTSAFVKNNRAKAIRCFSPPERLAPFSPISADSPPLSA
jgi:hypothetical protein